MSGECVIGVDLGGTKLVAAAVDGDLVVRYRAHRAVPGRNVGELLAATAEAVREVSDAVVVADTVGYGVAALIDDDRGVVTSSVHTPLVDVAFAALMAERTGLRAVVENDANLALLAELRHGAARDAEHALMLTLGTGVGGAIALGGALYRGAQGCAGELGHITVNAGGAKCGAGCPSSGCLEAYASGTALERDARNAARLAPDSPLGRAIASAGPSTLVGALVSDLADRGDPLARELLYKMGEWLGVGLASLVNVFNPEVIVIGGGVSGAREHLLPAAEAVMVSRALPLPARRVRLCGSRFGSDSGVIGASLLARERLAMVRA